MKCSKLILTFLACLFLASGAMAQKTKLQRANREYKQLNFQQAISMYLEILDKAESDEAKINLADAYRKIGNTAESEFWYGQIVYLPDAKPVYKLYYGQSLQANGKCDLAKEWFEQYSKDVPDDWRGRLLAQTCETNMVRNLNTARSRFYEIEALPFNTKMDDFAPTFYKNGMVFASERDQGSWKSRTHTWTGKPFLDMYFTEIDTLDAPNFEFTYEKEPAKYEKKLNTKYHDGPFFFSRDYNKVFLTRNNVFEGQTNRDDDGIVRLKIFEADLVDGKWSNMKGFPFNSDEYSVAHPTVTPDGQTMYFSSDMPGGFGGMDLYLTHYDNGQWSPPVNLGPRINTEGNEIFPTYHISGKLYFSSNGQLGLGGLDIYYTQDDDGVFGPIINMGAPLNSSADDFSVSLNDEETFGYFSSDRTGGVGDDDIYAFKLNIVDVEIFVFDENTGAAIPNANVFDACSEFAYKTDANGKVTIQMPTKECCKFSASMEAYTDNMEEVCTKDKVSGETMFAKIPLSQPLEFNLAGVVMNKKTGLPVEGALVTLANDCDVEYATATTDAAGNYFFELETKCCFRVKAEKEGYLADVIKTDICTRGKNISEKFTQDLELTPYVEDPTDPSFIFAGGNSNNANGESFVDEISSVPFVLEHVYYDFNKAYIREDAEEPLTELITIMTENPTIIVEIGSHTDARGSDRYNQQLSEARAKSVVEYLISSGIEKERLTYVGYGETDPTNDCVNEVRCSEDDHQRNRRTEFRVVGTVDGKQFSASSKKPQEIRKIDKCDNCPF
jgi:outer membrane protein OmpA-like peptidoglycan-associated protein/tetratricopeptide (TPR) repeat protein